MAARTLPLSPTLIAAFVVSMLVSLVEIGGQLLVSEDAWETIARWQFLNAGLSWLASILFAAGWAELARRAEGRVRVMLWLVVGASLTPVASVLVREVAEILVDDPRDLGPVLVIVGMVSTGLSIASAVLVTLAASAWRERRGAALVLVGLPVVTVGLLYVPATSRWLVEHRTAMAVLLATTNLLHLGALFVLILRLDRRLSAPSSSLVDARAGFTIAGNALWLRIMVALGVLTYAKSMSTWRWTPLFAALTTSGTQLAFCWGVLVATRREVAGLPRGRLVVGAALVAWSAAIQVEQAFLLRDLTAYGLGSYATRFTVFAPVVGVVGIVLVVSAMVSLATARSDEKQRERLVICGLAMTVLMVVSLGLAGDLDLGFRSLLAAALAGLGGTACLASACSRTARGLEHEHVVPSARALS